MRSLQILLLTLFMLLTCACGVEGGTAQPTATFTIPHQPGVADLWGEPPPAGKLVEVDAYFSGASALALPGIGRPPLALADQVTCPMIWGSTLSDEPFPSTLRLLNGASSNTLPDDEPWLIATIPEATEPGKSLQPELPYHARFRGRLGEPAFAHCEHAARIFVVEEVVIIYEQEPQEPPTYQLGLPEEYDSWPRYHDAVLGYSVPYPPDWTIEALSEANILGTVALRAPQWADYPVIVRVHEGETTYDQYEPSSMPPLLEGNGWSLFKQGWTFEGLKETQHLNGNVIFREASPKKGERAVLFSAHGRTYELSLAYPIGFEASQPLLTHLSAIVEGFQLDVPPTPTATPPIKQTLGEGPFLSQEEALAYSEERQEQTLDLIEAQLVSEAQARRLGEGCGTFFGHPEGVWVLTVRETFEEAQYTMQLFVDATTGEQLCGEELLP